MELAFNIKMNILFDGEPNGYFDYPCTGEREPGMQFMNFW